MENGYDLYEGLSFFQKSIREAKLEQALYWGYYLFLSKSYATSAFRRMRIITHEDIGLANLEAIILIDELHNRWKKVEWDNRDDNYWKIAIKYLCESNKNKENDWYLILGKYKIKHGWKPDKTSNLIESIRNKNEKEAFYHAYNLIGENDNKFWSIIKDNVSYDQFINACNNSYLECKKSKGADGFWSLSLLYIIRLFYFKFKEIDIHSKINKLLEDRIIFDNTDKKPEIPDYYYDMHTYKGKIKGKGFKHWFQNCKVDPYYKYEGEKYCIDKSMMELLDKESFKK